MAVTRLFPVVTSRPTRTLAKAADCRVGLKSIESGKALTYNHLPSILRRNAN